MTFLAAIPAWAYLAAGTAFQAFGAISQGNAQAREYKFQSQQLEQNARINDMNARMAVDQAAVEERNQRVRMSRLLGEQRVAYGKSGVTSAGTPLLVQEDSWMEGELDALTTRYQGTVKSNNYKYEAASNRASSAFAKAAGKTAKANGRTAALGTILGGAASYYGAPKVTQPTKAASSAGSDRYWDYSG
jgi:hypothetical protein